MDALKEHVVDAVLGLSVTPSALSVAVVDGSADRCVTVEGETFRVDSARGDRTATLAAAAVRRAQHRVAVRGGRVTSIGVTFSAAARPEAAQLIETLSAEHVPDIVEVRLPEATDALARDLGDATGHPTSAVCLIEPGQLIALLMHAAEGAVQTAVNHTAVTEEDLTDWLETVFSRAGRMPGTLVLMGSAEDLDGLAPVLQQTLSVPVSVPADAALALARGAALACADDAALRTWDGGDARRIAAPRNPMRRRAAATPAAMLAAGAVAFVASVSAALTLEFGPSAQAPSATARPSGQLPAALIRPVPMGPPVAAPAAPPEVRAAVPVAPVEATPSVEAAPIIEAAPVDEAAPIIEAAPIDEAAPPVEMPPPPPPVEMPPPPAPEDEPGLMQRIRDRLAGLGDEQPEPAPGAPPPVLAPPPPQ